MPTKAVPLNMPEELLERVRATAERVNLSMADVMRQAIDLGMPTLEERLLARNPPSGYFAGAYKGAESERRAKLEDKIAKTTRQTCERCE